MRAFIGSLRLTRVVPLVVLLGLVGLTAVSVLAASALRPQTARADGPHIDAVTFQRDVDPASARFLTDAIDTAQSDGAALLLVRLDTPGGDLDSMKLITQKEINCNLPIVVYIAPQNARAGSAGTFIALAAPVVAMAPNTRIGAASPISSTGQDLETTLDTKIKNDLEAQLRANQATYGRNADLAVKTVSDAASYDDQEAIQNHLVNFGAPTDDDLLVELDGMPLTLATGKTVTLQTSGVGVNELQPTLANQLETVFLDPTVVFILFIVAAVCIYLELSHPGAIVPGTVGAIALVIFLFAAGALNPNWTGLVLMLLAIVLLAVDVRVPTHGVLTVGALISLVVGSLIFFDSGASRGGPTVSPFVIAGAAIGFGLISLVVISYAIRSRHGRTSSGGEGLIGQTATVIVTLAPEGRVRILGEDWAARLPGSVGPRPPIDAGQQVRVKGRDGLALIVEPLQTPHN
ncbi:MAG: NfeD family protein [Ktedonobacterales bacterium]